MKILFVSDLSFYALAHSFMRAMKFHGQECAAFDVESAIGTYVRGGRVGAVVHRFISLEAWTRKGNRELALEALNFKPDLLFVIGNAPIHFGTLAFIKSALPTRAILYWPDPLPALSAHHSACAPLYDWVATYSSATIEVLQQIGFRNPVWLPFGGDPEFQGLPTSFDGEFAYDISFAGGWRPERERVFKEVKRRLPNLRMAIFGKTWLRFCRDPLIKKYCLGRDVFGKQYGDLIRASAVTLNQIDETNHSGANMRFFEVPSAGGLQLSSYCPEFAEEFVDGRDVLYFRNAAELIEKMEWINTHSKECAAIREQGHRRVVQAHTYRHRMAELLGIVAPGWKAS